MIKAIAFDMDGTLLDSMPIWDDVGALFLAKYQIQPLDTLRQSLATMSLQQGCEYLKKQYTLAQSAQDIQQEIEQIIYEQYAYHIPLKLGVKQCIEYCVQQGIILCVVTACSETLANIALQRCGIRQAFEFIMTCDKVGCSKQDPYIYQKTLEELHVHKEECIFVDDAIHAITCLKQEGYSLVAVYDESNKKEWEILCEMSDEHYVDLSKWEVNK